MSATLTLLVAVPPAVLATAVLSGVFGMAGGLILMAVYAVLLPVPAAMVLHGVTQLAANGSRCVLLWRHVRWRPVGVFLAGSAVSVAVFAGLAVVADRRTLFLALGAGTLVAQLLPPGAWLSIERRATAFVGGAVVTAAQLLAGASGPLLDVLYVRSSLDRRSVVASKAFTQTVGHLVKIAYFGALVPAGDALDAVPLWLYPLVAAVAVAGTRLGRACLERLDEQAFRRWSGRLVLALSVLCLARGLTVGGA